MNPSLQIFVNAIKNLPARYGSAPRMTPHNPQEQLEQFPSDWSLIEQLAVHAFALDRVVERPTQIAPPGSRALTLDEHDTTPDRHAFMVELEFAHIHNPPIGSIHLTLPKALRHPLAARGIVSPDVVFVFAPRDAAELAAAKLLLEASHAYARGRLAAQAPEHDQAS
jgi:hypothetical protein